MLRTIILNNLKLSKTKSDILKSFVNEYRLALEHTFLFVLDANNSFDLNNLTYSDIKSTSSLPSDIIQEARKDVWKIRKDIIKKGIEGKFGFKHISIRLNQKWFKFVLTKRKTICVKITYSPRKTFAIPIKIDNQFKRFVDDYIKMNWKVRMITLFESGKIAVTVHKNAPEVVDEQKCVIGIDIGSSTLCATTIFDIKTSKVLKQYYFGRDVAIKQRKFDSRRKKLWSLADKGSHKAKKSLKKLKHSQNNFVRTRSGQIAKEIINLAIKYNAYISIEKLKNLRAKKGQFSRKSRRKINSIPYGLLINYLKSNCEKLGIKLIEVDPYHTSKWCTNCGAVNDGHLAGNYSLYKCKECGMVVNSDRKASLAIAIKSLLERTKHTTTKTVQISRRRVPVNGLLRSNDGVLDIVTV